MTDDYIGSEKNSFAAPLKLTATRGDTRLGDSVLVQCIATRIGTTPTNFPMTCPFPTSHIWNPCAAVAARSCLILSVRSSSFHSQLWRIIHSFTFWTTIRSTYGNNKWH